MSDSAESRAAPTITPLGVFADGSLEKAYREELLPRGRRFLGFTLALGSGVFFTYGLHDYLVVPSVMHKAWLVRYGGFGTVSLLCYGLLFSKYWLKLSQFVLWLYATSAASCVLYIASISPPSGFFIYTSFASLFVTLAPFILRLRVLTQVAYTLTTLVAYGVLDGMNHNGTWPTRFSVILTLISMGGIGALLAFKLERQSREAYAQRREIERQVAQIQAEKERSEELLLNVLPPSIAARLKAEERTIADGFGQVSVLFADIVGFTPMSERLTAEELVRRLNEIFSNFDDLVDKLKLEKIKTIGDCYMVAGGLHSHEYDHAQAIAEMALAMRRRTAMFSQRYQENPQIRIGIHTGPVVAGVIGKRKFIYDVWGDTVNTASRMESHSKPGQIQVTAETHELLREDYRFEQRAPLNIKGKGEMQTYFLLGSRKTGAVASTQLPRLKDG